MNEVMNNIPAIINIVTLVIAVAAAITALTPTPKDDAIVAKVLKLVNFLALNFGNAKNAADEKKK